MPEKKTLIICPNCGRRKDLSLHLHGFAIGRFPIEKGQIDPAGELLLKVKLAGQEDPLIQYSDVSEESRVSLFLNESQILIHCPICKAVFDAPKGMKIQCKDAK